MREYPPPEKKTFPLAGEQEEVLEPGTVDGRLASTTLFQLEANQGGDFKDQKIIFRKNKFRTDDLDFIRAKLTSNLSIVVDHPEKIGIFKT